MGVFDNIKDSIKGSESSKSSSGSSSGGGLDSDLSSDFNSDQFNESFKNDSPSPDQRNNQGKPPVGEKQSDIGSQGSPGSPGGNHRQDAPLDPQEPAIDQQRQPQGRQGRKENQQRRNKPSGSRSPQDSPNPQTGRPREGGVEPQLSSQTEKEMEHAGMNTGQERSVADRKDEIEELKRQNEQIIELLKRINDSIESQGSSGSRRHGGRR